MKLLPFAVVMLCFVVGPASGQPATNDGALEQEIRALEHEESTAVLRGDLPALERLWAEDFTVNNPQHRISGSRQEVLNLVRSGVIKYSSFERTIEAIRIHGDTVIVMGREVVTPVRDGPEAGQPLPRRYTNIWMKNGNEWRLTARHANAICRD
jgi:ketosteroid isomerase-like protein